MGEKIVPHDIQDLNPTGYKRRIFSSSQVLDLGKLEIGKWYVIHSRVAVLKGEETWKTREVKILRKPTEKTETKPAQVRVKYRDGFVEMMLPTDMGLSPLGDGRWYNFVWLEDPIKATATPTPTQG